MSNGLVIRVPSNNVLPDLKGWTNRFAIAGTSGNQYIVSQHAEKRHWGCSCPGWRVHRKCKHLSAIGLPAHEVPFEAKLTTGAR